MKAATLKARQCLLNIVPYQPGKPIAEVKREFGLTDVIKLASNENPLGPSPRAMAAAQKALAQVELYPDGASYDLRRALAKVHGWDPKKIILGCGSNELILLLGQAFLEPGDEVLTAEMTFVVYPTVAQLAEAQLVAVPLKKFTFDLKALAQAITPLTKMIFISNPNNPTGTAIAPKELGRFLANVPAACLVVLDEAYFEYLDAPWRPDSLAWAERYPNLVLLRTFSKAYGLAGLRVGYGLVSEIVAQAVERVRAPFNVNSVAQAAALAALADKKHMTRSVALAKRERVWLGAQLGKAGFSPVPSQANFIFVAVPWGTGQAWFMELMKLGVIVRPMPGPYLRITVGTRPQNQRLLAAIKEVQQTLFNG